ncbi:MAG: DUF4139 domain-containing protein [Myxococcales bacterium]
MNSEMTDVLSRPDGPVAGKAVKVTLYEDRAEVVRKASVSVQPGAQWVAVGGVTPFVDDRSVQAKVTAQGVRVLAARVRRRVTLEAEVGREEIDWLESAERSARLKVAAAEQSQERSEASARRLAALFRDWRKALSQVPLGAREAAISAWKSSYGALAEKLVASALERVSAQFDEADAREALVRAQALLAQGKSTKPLCEAAVEIQLEAQAGAKDVELLVTYRTPCALWRPEHLVRLVTESDEAKQGKVELLSWATVWQLTGERWEGVEAVFSTARPARAAVPPMLSPDLLSTRRKTEEEKKTIHVEMRDQAVTRAGDARGKRAVEEMPGVDDGGLPLAFSPNAPVTLPSDGTPFRVEINRTTLDAAVARVLYPERSVVAHYQATATLSDKVPLLAGPLRVARGAGLVGRARMNFVAPGEPFTLGFGPDDALRVRRTLESKRDTTMLTGTQKIERKVKLFLSNLSDAEKRVELTERIPVSEIGDVEIQLLEAKGFEHDVKDGFLKATIAVAPRETKELLVKYEVRAKSNVALPF